MRPSQSLDPVAAQGPNLLRHVEGGCGTAQALSGGLCLLGPQGAAMAGRGVLLAGAALPDAGPGRHQGGSPRFQGLADGLVHGGRVVPVNRLDVPAIGPEAACDFVRAGHVRPSVDSDAVVVVEADQVIEPQVPGQRGGFVGDALHQVSVRGQDVDAVIQQRLLRCVEPGSGHLGGQGHARPHGQALAQRPGGHFDPRGMAELGMARGAAAPLPEILDVVHGDLIAEEMQQAVKQHRAVPGREDEPVAVGPLRILGVELKEIVPESEGQVGGTHGHAGVAGVGLLHGVDRQHPQGVGAELVLGGGQFGHIATTLLYNRV